MTFPYIRDIPESGHNPSNDQPNMKINNNSIEDLIAVDHLGFNDSFNSDPNSGGYHTIIHQIRQSSNPALIPQINQLFCKNYTPDTTGGTADVQLFSTNGSGGTVQLTGTSQQSDGWAWVGGILLQWGSVTASIHNTSGTVTFKDRVAGAIPFPNNCFMVQTTPFTTAAPSSDNSASIAVKPGASLTRLKFDWIARTASLTYTGFFWFAVGN